jgi:hypothetical protein
MRTPGQRLLTGVINLLRLTGTRCEVSMPTLKWHWQRGGVSAGSTGVRHSLHVMCPRSMWQDATGLILRSC